MPRAFVVASLFFAWLCANGAIWDVLQVASWSRMLAGYSETMNLSQALETTLDPENACGLCRGIAQAKKSADEAELPGVQKSDTKIVMIAHAVDRPAFDHQRERWADAGPKVAAARSDPVRLRPPRA